MDNALHDAALYIRVSTDKQEELSPDAQKRLLLDYAKTHKLFVAPEHIFVENGISGRKADKRPEFQKMVGLAKSPERPFQSILVWKFSRFARNQEESIVYKSMLKKQYGVDVVSITEPLIDGPFGSLIERIIEWMDEYYSINLSSEVVRGMTEKALRGGYQSTPSLGYTAPGNGQPFVIVPEEAEVVKYIFHQYVYDHKDVTAIARKLNDGNLLTKRGNHFEKRNITYILRNKFYIGKVIWNGIEKVGVHETFISEELFRAANERLDAEFRPVRRRNVSVCKHWLSGLLKCSVCGSTLAMNGSKEKFFQCWKYAKGIHTRSQYISVSKVEKATIEYLESLLNGTDFTFAYHSPAATEKKNESDLYASELKRLKDRERRVREAYEAGIDTLEEYKENRNRLQAEKKRLTELIATCTETAKEEINDKEIMKEKIRTLCDVLKDPNVSYDEKGTFIRSIVEEIVWEHDDNTLIFRLYMPENP